MFLNILLSLFLGTLLGVGIGFLVELLDRRVRSGQDIAGLDIPVLAEVTKKGRRWKNCVACFAAIVRPWPERTPSRHSDDTPTPPKPRFT